MDQQHRVITDRNIFPRILFESFPFYMEESIPLVAEWARNIHRQQMEVSSQGKRTLAQSLAAWTKGMLAKLEKEHVVDDAGPRKADLSRKASKGVGVCVKSGDGSFSVLEGMEIGAKVRSGRAPRTPLGRAAQKHLAEYVRKELRKGTFWGHLKIERVENEWVLFIGTATVEVDGRLIEVRHTLDGLGRNDPGAFAAYYRGPGGRKMILQSQEDGVNPCYFIHPVMIEDGMTCRFFSRYVGGPDVPNSHVIFQLIAEYAGENIVGWKITAFHGETFEEGYELTNKRRAAKILEASDTGDPDYAA